MKKLLLVTMFLVLIGVFPIKTMAAVDIHIGFPLPPPIPFPAPPEVIVIPETYVYVVPDIDANFFFWNGWWWRLWQGRWYRSHYYHDRGWAYYDRVPSFYFDIDPGWRRSYRDHHWYGHPWNCERIPYRRLQQNWKIWHDNRHWERRGTWGVQGYQPRPQPQRQELRHQRQLEYQQRPEVQQHQQQRQEQLKQQQQRQPQVKQPQQQHSQPQGQPHQGGSQHPRSQGKSKGGDAEHRK